LLALQIGHVRRNTSFALAESGPAAAGGAEICPWKYRLWARKNAGDPACPIEILTFAGSVAAQNTPVKLHNAR